MPCPCSRVTVSEPSVPTAVTVQVSRLRTGSPADVIEGAVVAAGGDNVADVSALSAGDLRGDVGVEVSGGDSGGLDGVVDGVDMIIRRGDEGDGVAAARVVLDPRFGHRGEVALEAAGDDPVVGFVGVEGAGIAGSQLQ